MKRLLLLASLALAWVLMPGSPGLAQSSGGPYEIRKHTIDGGGDYAEGGNYKMTASIGQADAGSPQQGGSYHLAGGFWPNDCRVAADDGIFRSGFQKNC